jgi:hypothetical protein
MRFKVGQGAGPPPSEPPTSRRSATAVPPPRSISPPRGALSGYYERGLGLWDLAAGAALCIAAGINAVIVWEADQAPFILKAVPGL